ncbi:metalloregulator ArsR/SmtB family transcription factor [Gordonia sp. CPCC 205515]|uniref:ArsR/SmtB family transcription factor n=1 Tax=Gordonia sp. CPCC 205515 TaxID=3140791 RepID=UPI003AF37DF4
MKTISDRLVVVNPDARTREAASDLLRALASPTRIAIVLSLRENSQCVHELVGALELNQPLVSQHLRVLKDAGVVRGNRNGREIIYELVDDHLAHIVVDAVAHSMESDDRAVTE